MAVRLTLMGVLVLAAMAGYLAASVALLLRARKLGLGLFAAGFVLAAGAVVLRWREVGHVPMQNLFEVFLVMGCLVFPVSVFCRRVLGVGGEAADAAVAFLVLFPAAFVLNPNPQQLPPALQSALFVPHVAAYLLGYVILAKAGVQAACGLVRVPGAADGGAVSCERATYRMVSLGFPLLTLGLVLGAVWGKLAWGDYWNWDPKELWSLASWLIYLGYLHFRGLVGSRYRRAGFAIVFCGAAAMVVTLLWVNLARIFAGLHSYA